MALNIITAKFCSGATQAWASEAWQYDYGQVLQFDGVDMPEAYQVHFSNEPMTGETITQIGNADGVSIPDQFFQNGEPIFAWVYLHEGEDDGETVYMVTIPVKKRPQPSDEVPTPVEQSAIDQAIAALNIAVEKADEAITHYPTIIDGTWHVWDVTTGEYVDTGVEARGPQGEHGETGPQGEPGKDGVSPTITVTDITDGHRVTITDANGTKTFDVLNGAQGEPGTPGAKGAPGADGVSPTVTVTEITGGHRVTITDASGDHTFDVLDGEDGTTPTVDSAMSSTSENPVQNKVITQELTDVKEDLNDKADVIISTASGSIAHFEDGAEADAVSVIAHIEPVQDLHGYDNPWPAGGGVNLLDFGKITVSGTHYGMTFSKGQNEGTVTVTGTLTVSGGAVAPIVYADNSLSGKGYVFLTEHISGDSVIDLNSTYGFRTENEKAIAVFLSGNVGQSYTETIRISVYATTQTSWTPYSNICPISGFTGMDVQRTGKNLLNPTLYSWQSKSQNGISYEVQNDGSIHASGTATAIGGPVLCSYVTLPNGTYSFLDESVNHIRCAYGKRDKTSGATSALSNPFTVDGSFEIYINVYCDSNGTFDYYLHPQIELGSTATAYEPYQGETYPITFPSEAGTVYGGYVDVTNGKLVVDREIVTASHVRRYTNDRGYYWYSTSSDMGASEIKSLNAKLVSNRLHAISNVTLMASEGEMTWYANNIVRWKEQGSMTLTEYQAYLVDNPLQFCYELATPIEYDITPQQIKLLKGYNNIWNSAGGKNEVQYKADTKLYIDNLLGTTEDDMTANANIASGKFFSVGNRLFLSTAAIAQGATIVPGTNCMELTISEALNQVNA